MGNQRLIERRFGYLARRRQRADLLKRPGFWASSAPRIAFAVTEASDTTPAGDYFTAKEFAENISKLVTATIIYLERKRDWYNLQGIDVLVVMVADYDLARIKNAAPHLIKVGWARNWIEKWEANGAGYDVMWASSTKSAEYLARRLAMPIEVVAIATNPSVFAPREASEELVSDYCFTGSFWNQPREIMYKLEPRALPFRFAVFGQGWDQVANFAPYHRGLLPYSRMAEVYASTKIVIDDANSVTKQWGSVNSRVFDAIAAGALVITNGGEGAQSLFDGLLPAYDTRQELEALLWRYLEDDEQRQALVEKLRQKVLDSHTYAHRARQAFENLKAVGGAQIRIAIKIGAPNEKVRDEWGDYHFAVALKRAFKRSGHTVRIDCLDSWYAAPSLGDDVAIVLRGLSRYAPRADQINLAWIISHPDDVSVGEFESYDHVFVASDVYARQLATRTTVPVTPLLQCTDPEVFYDAVDRPQTTADVLFVGNSRNVFRPVVKDSYFAGLDVSVYGKGWKAFLPDQLVKGEHIPPTELAAHYRHAGVVLNDHWDDMREKGFISNRLFDCAASGARVVSDPVPGMRELFGDLVATYSSARELPGLVEALRTEPETRQEERAALAARIRRDHSFDVRAAEILRVIETLDAAKRTQWRRADLADAPADLSDRLVGSAGA
jgi:spore maturation protein CgeB